MGPVSTGRLCCGRLTGALHDCVTLAATKIADLAAVTSERCAIQHGACLSVWRYCRQAPGEQLRRWLHLLAPSLFGAVHTQPYMPVRTGECLTLRL